MWFRWLALCFVVACGGARPTIHEQIPGEHVEPTGLRVITLPRPTPNVVRLSLWIDAGARDVSPPQVATLSAWVAARAGGEDVHARVLPDATELWIECGSDEVERAVEALGHALAARDADNDTWKALQAQLRSARAAHETDARHVAERAALVAALGETLANEFLPFGRADDDTDATVESAQAFLADHFGPNRSLLVSVGDVPAAALSRSIGAHLAAVPRARRSRTERSFPIEATAPTARVERASAGWAAIAVASTHRQAANEASRAVRRAWSTRNPEAHELALRGGAIAIVLAPTVSAIELIRQAAAVIAEPHARHEQSTERAREDLAALTEAAGIQFCAPDNRTNSTTMRIGYGVALNDATRAGPEDEQRAQARISATEREVQQVIEATARAPQFRGDVGTQAAHVVLNNGARISVQRRASNSVGIAIRLLGGASEEHHTSHGRTALLSLLSAQACEGIGPGALAARLNALGAELSPVLDSTSFGLRLSAPAVHWEASVELITRCALSPALHRRALRDAQARMLSTLSPDGAHGRSALVASHLSPTHPATIAPWGGPNSVLLDLDSVSRAHRLATVGARLSIAVVGDVPVPETVERIARRFASLPSGALPATPEPSGEADEVAALSATGEKPAAIVMFRVRDDGLDPVGARGFAALLAEELTHTPSISLTWLDAGAWAQGAWAAVGLSMPIETLDELNAVIDRALHTLGSAVGRTRAIALTTAATQQEARALSEPVQEADARARQMITGFDSAPNATRAMHAFDSFVQARPRYLVSRGRAVSAPRTSTDNRP